MIALPSGFSPQEYLALEAQSPIRHEYRQILTFEEYLLIAQTEQQIEVFRRDNSGWRSQIYSMGKRFTLESIGLQIAVADLYRGTSLELAI